MARNNWPYLLRVLLKAGWTPEGLRHAADVSEERFRDHLSGKREPEMYTAAIYRGILNRHKRREGLTIVHGRLRPVQLAVPLTPAADQIEQLPRTLPRGVFEDPCPPAGYRVFRAIADDGTELVSLRFHWRAEERDVVPGLRAWLNRADPIIRLIEPDVPSEQTS